MTSGGESEGKGDREEGAGDKCCKCPLRGTNSSPYIQAPRQAPHYSHDSSIHRAGTGIPATRHNGALAP